MAEKSTRSKDEVFKDLVIALSQMHEFYTDPNLRIKYGKTPKDNQKTEYDVDKFGIALEKARPTLQLFGNESTDYNYLVPNTKDDWAQNPYFKLYAFLHDETEKTGLFTKFQKEDAGILWAMFAYVDATSHTEPVKYLFEPSTVEEDKNLRPHFLFRAYYIDSMDNKEFKSVDYKTLDNLAKAASYARKKAKLPSDVDFVYVLQSYRKRTDFEYDNDMMYISSGEMDCCILQWLILILKNGKKEHSMNDKMSFDVKEISEIIIDRESVSKIKIPYSDEGAKGLIEWLEIWGLVKIITTNDDIDKADFELLPRAHAMLYWLSVYLKSINSQKNKKEAPEVYGVSEEQDYWRVLALGDKFFDYSEEEGFCYLDGCDVAKQKELISAVYGANKLDIKTGKKQFLNLLHLMFKWNETKNVKNDEAWQTFQKRCRLSTFIHYLHRFGEKERPNIEVSRETTGLLAFPVLWDTIFEDTKLERKPVGIFMSIIKEENENGQSYFKDFKLPGDDVEFKNKIKRIRTIVSILAKVENIEIYQKGIRKHQENERLKYNSLNAIPGSMHFFRSWIDNMFMPIIDEPKYRESIAEGLVMVEIVNLISKIHKERDMSKKEEILNSSNYIMTKEPFQINHVVNKFNSRIIKGKKIIKFSIRDNVIIETIVAPTSFFNELFYNLLFCLIIENAVPHAPGDSSFLTIEISPQLNNAGEVTGLVIKNSCGKKELSDKDREEKKPYTGGLFYFDTFLTIARKGEIKFRYDDDYVTNQPCFLTILKLNQLKLLKK